MKRLSIFLMASIFYLGQMHGETQKEIEKIKMQALVVSGHNRSFGVDNLFFKQLDCKPWEDVIVGLHTYVIKNYKNFFGIKDPLLSTSLARIEEISLKMVNALKVGYGIRSNKKNLQGLITLFEDLEQNALIVQQWLRSVLFGKNQTNKKDAQEILNMVAKFIEVTAAKAQQDILKL